MPSPVADETASRGLLRWPACWPRAGSAARLSSMERSTIRSSLDNTTRAGAGEEYWVECAEFADKNLIVVQGIGLARVEQEDEDPRPLDVTEELVAEALAFVGALDQAWNVRQYEAVVFPQLDDAQVGFEGGEGIVGQFGSYGGQAGQKGGFARVRVADEPHVGDQLQLQFEQAFLRPDGLPRSAGAPGW